MASASQTTVFDDLVELLAESADPQRLLAFRLSPEKQSRLDDLLERNRQHTLTPDEVSELDEFKRIEHVVRILKARVRQKRKQ